MVNGEITLKEALVRLYGWSHWHRIISENPKYFPGKNLLLKGLKAADKGVESPCRKTVIRLVKLGKCVACGSPVTISSGDHVIPISKGGPQSVENYMPLCKNCSSKGNHDLLEWWISRGCQIQNLNPDALIVYLRLKHRYSQPAERNAPAPPYVLEALRQAEQTLPFHLRIIWKTWPLNGQISFFQSPSAKPEGGRKTLNEKRGEKRKCQAILIKCLKNSESVSKKNSKSCSVAFGT
jgi:hypothetical protein